MWVVLDSKEGVREVALLNEKKGKGHEAKRLCQALKPQYDRKKIASSPGERKA